jgi:hypothetical protein
MNLQLKTATTIMLALIIVGTILNSTNTLNVNATITSVNSFGSIGVITYSAFSSWLHTSGIKIYNSQNQEIIFNGVSTTTLFGWEPPAFPPNTVTYTETHMDTVRSHGINLIRLDVPFSSSVWGIPYTQQTPTNITFNSAVFPYLDRLINQCAEDGLWVNICFVMNEMSPLQGWGADIDGGGVGFPTWMYNASWNYFNKTYARTSSGLSNAIRDFWNINDSTAANIRTAYETWWFEVADHYKNSPNVFFGLFNEPQSGGSDNIWGVSGQPTQEEGAAMYKSFVEHTIDRIRTVAPNNLIIVNDAYFWYWNTNPKIDRPNIIIENHIYYPVDQYNLYGNNPTNDPLYVFKLGWRYNQPFLLGEFGGIEEGNLQNRADSIHNMQFCNQYNVSWSYLSFRPLGNWVPSTQTWTDIGNNLNPFIKYYQ